MAEHEAAGESSPTILLRLYVAGDSVASGLARRQLEELLERVGREVEVEVIDVLEQPEIAEEARVLATPMLVRHAPPPPRSVIGDLADERTVMALLGLEDIGPPR